MIGTRTLAPTLEHGNRSNDKQSDRTHRENLHQHDQCLRCHTPTRATADLVATYPDHAVTAVTPVAVTGQPELSSCLSLSDPTWVHSLAWKSAHTPRTAALANADTSESSDL